MLRTLIVLPDGTELFSGNDTENAIVSSVITQSVNRGSELTLGSVCSNMLEVLVITPGGRLAVSEGQELAAYKVDDAGERHLVGLFTTERPTRNGANSLKLTAYDRVSWLDRDLTQWLNGLDGWPYTLLTFGKMVCDACGVTLQNESIPNGEFMVQKMTAEGITGRQLMQWVGEACGRFCRANADGTLELAWYTPTDIAITASGDGAYFSNGFACEDYQVEPIEKVQIQLTGNDLGAGYPDSAVQCNTYRISGNGLLASGTRAQLETVAQNIFTELQTVTYTPCKVSVRAGMILKPGDIVQVTDRNGQTFTVYVMTKTQTGQTDTLECTGSARRDSSTAVNSFKFTTLGSKVMEVQANMEGLRIANRELAGRMTSAETEIAQNTQSIALSATRTEVVAAAESAVAEANAHANTIGESVLVSANQNTDDKLAEYEKTVASRFEQTAESISMNFKTTVNIREDVDAIKSGGVEKVTTSTGFTFDADGMTVAKSGKEMKTQITEDGMTVYKNNSAVLTANNQGVDAVNLKASTYLVIGGKSRFENYGTARTGCFWVG